ncbi:MAG: ASKHA domain-containing protein [Lachnospiraceae bacterium]|nr:ASKHA domain-containing protein [Lachnospiraceae bacterium]
MSVEIRILESAQGKCAETLVYDSFDHTTWQGFFDRHNVPINYMCGRAGICGKCKIHFLQGAPVPTEEEEDYFTEAELAEGYRLACMCGTEKSTTSDADMKNASGAAAENVADVIIELVPYPGYLQSSDRHMQKIGKSNQRVESEMDSKKDLATVAVDLGTTTVAFAYLNPQGEVISQKKLINPNCGYGADVISRMSSYNLDGEDITRQLQDFIFENVGEYVPLVISGNTIMSHMLLGLDCQGLSVAPFKPVILNYNFQDKQDIYIVPGASAFIGGDILSGLYYLDADTWQDTTLFIDLGTNGEMVLYHDGKYFSTSASAGPAMEGVNISCGMPSVDGAIYSIMMVRDRSVVKTISGIPAEGICGSGLIDAIYGLRQNGLLDENGIFADEYRDSGYTFDTPGSKKEIRLTQEDVREFMLAKAAIATGWQMLMEYAGIEEGQLDRVYIAGSFGNNIDVSKSRAIGLLPDVENIKAVGNTSLEGATRIARDLIGINHENAEYAESTNAMKINEKYDNIPDIVDDKLQNLARTIINVVLPEDDRFQEVFVSNIRL